MFQFLNSVSQSPSYRWLNGKYVQLSKADEYLQIMQNPSELECFDRHPDEIYFQPKSIHFLILRGQLYLIRDTQLWSLGFPRLENHVIKRYKWKKMNFMTSIPKHNPKVTYVVCSTCSETGQLFRMHIVCPYDQRHSKGMVLCHILEISLTSSPQDLDVVNYDEIRRSNETLLDSVNYSYKLIGEASNLSLKYSLFDNDSKYLYQKLYNNHYMQSTLDMAFQVKEKIKDLELALVDCEEVLDQYDLL